MTPVLSPPVPEVAPFDVSSLVRDLADAAVRAEDARIRAGLIGAGWTPPVPFGSDVEERAAHAFRTAWFDAQPGGRVLAGLRAAFHAVRMSPGPNAYPAPGPRRALVRRASSGRWRLVCLGPVAEAAVPVATYATFADATAASREYVATGTLALGGLVGFEFSARSRFGALS